MSKAEEFLNYIKTVTKKNNIKLIISNEESILYPDSDFYCSGYFGDDVLGIAIGGDPKNWLSILVHEFSHMEQFLENADVWNNLYDNEDGEEAMDIIDRWIHGEEVDNIEKYVKLSFNVESDCERRSIDNIRKFNLDIDIPTYYQKSNSYILFYGAVLENRQWYAIDKKPYLIEELYSRMPNDVIISDLKEYSKYSELYKKYCF